MKSLGSKDEATLLPAEETRARQGGSCSRLWPDDPKETPITGLRGRSSRPRLRRAASPATEVQAPRLAFDFLLVGKVQLREFMFERKTRQEISVNKSHSMQAHAKNELTMRAHDNHKDKLEICWLTSTV